MGVGGHLLRGEAELTLRAIAPTVLLGLCAAAWAYGTEGPIALAASAQPAETAESPQADRESLRPLRSLPDPETAEKDWGYLTSRPAEDGLSMALPWDNPRFQKFRQAYQTQGGSKWLETVMARSAPYAQYVAERIRWYGLPEELFFLPVIESEWSARVVSRSGAAGLWQFMKNSIGGYDMRVNEWVDERRDFMKSTDAALRKLKGNYETLGSWEMALAAYNCGLGAVSRAAARAGTRDYWELCAKGLLPAQTVSYVPKYLAVVSLLSRGARNGFALSEEPPAEWERVELDKPVDIALLAEAAGVSLSDLQTGNMELRYGVTPPEGDYALKVPSDCAPSIREALARPDFKAMRYYLYKIRSGDTLSALAQHYEVSLALIEKFNPGIKPHLLKIGSTVVIPALKDKKPYVSAPSPGESLDFSAAYVVAKGDTLWSISLRYGVQPETLAQRNGMDISSILREGMTLKVPRME